MRTKPASRPLVREGGQGHPHEVALGRGVQPGVVALRLDVEHVGARHESAHPAELDDDALVGRPSAAARAPRAG